MHQNVAVAEAVVLSCFRPEPPRNRVVYERGNFPSRALPLPGRGPSSRSSCARTTAAIVDAIDERTLLVPISHVLFQSGEIQDVGAIVRRAHEVGAHVVLDAYQSAGIVPLDVTALGRRLRGRRLGQVALRRARERLALRPPRPRRAARADRDRLAGARRSRSPSRRSCATRTARRASSPARRTCPRSTPATAGYDLIEEVGVARIREQLAAPDRAADRAGGRRRLRGPEPARPARRGGTVTVHVPSSRPCTASCGAREIVCDFRPGAGLRLGPHFFTTDDELRHAVAQIAEILETGAYERHLGALPRH